MVDFILRQHGWIQIGDCICYASKPKGDYVVYCQDDNGDFQPSTEERFASGREAAEAFVKRVDI